MVLRTTARWIGFRTIMHMCKSVAWVGTHPGINGGGYQYLMVGG